MIIKMNKAKTMGLAIALTVASNALAGGILTNTNQNVVFLRNPARDAAIGIDGTYSNPAGVAFMDNGWHLSFNWQVAKQTRTITSTNPLFQMGAQNNGQSTKTYEGKASAPFLPSLQAAYNKDKWSFQGTFAVTGGGGKCTFDNGLGSFESAVASIANQLVTSTNELKNGGIDVPVVTGYDMDSYMRGKQYYFGLQLGAAYKINEHWSVYGGLRLLYGTASYKAKMENIQVITTEGQNSLPEYFTTLQDRITATGQQIANGIGSYVAAYMNAGMTEEQAYAQPTVQALQQKLAAVESAGEQLTEKAELLAPYANGVNLQSDQTGLGIAPILGVDFKTGAFNFAAKYEFKTRMRMKNTSTVKEASIIPAINKFLDGSSVSEDSPALLTVGAQWAIVPSVRVSAGYHLFFDKSAHWYDHQERLLDGNTWELNGGVEWDITDKLQISGGMQTTNYGLTDDYMNDMSFVVSSYTYGFGLGYQLTKKLKVNVAYFQTNYDTYNRVTSTEPLVSDSFTRTNHVFGVGVDFSL